MAALPILYHTGVRIHTQNLENLKLSSSSAEHSNDFSFFFFTFQILSGDSSTRDNSVSVYVFSFRNTL